MSLRQLAACVVGRYALYREIASGGMATVYFGRLRGPLGFSRAVAIKRLHAQFARDPEFVAMFVDEARLAARLRHPNIVPTLDVVSSNGEVFLVMEYVQGESLAQLFELARERGEIMPTRIATSIVSGMLLGLHAAHETRSGRGALLNLVHRDVSPHNVLVGLDGTARLLDFGVAKAEGRAQHMTGEGRVKGKLCYMAPEQLRGAQVGRSADIYGAAVVLWEALAGRKLFARTADAVEFVRTLHPPIPPPSAYRANLSPELDQVVLRGLAPDPSLRFGTALEIAVALERAGGAVSVIEVAAWVDRMAGARIGLRGDEMLGFEGSGASPMPESDRWSTRDRGPLVPPAAPSAGPMQVDVEIELTSASTPFARALRLRDRRVGIARAAAGMMALGVLGTWAARTARLPQAEPPPIVAVSPGSPPRSQARPADAAVAADASSSASSELVPDAIPVMSLPIAPPLHGPAPRAPRKKAKASDRPRTP